MSEDILKAMSILADHLEIAANEIRALISRNTLDNTAFVDHVRDSFPEDLRSNLSFTDEGNQVLVKPTAFLGSETFAKIAAIVSNLKGEYLSAGKESHFRVPK